MAQAGEHIEQLSLSRLRIADSVGRDQRRSQSARQLDHRLIADLFGAMKMTLQFEIDVLLPEDALQALHSAARQIPRQRTILVAGQANQTFRKLGQLILCHGGFLPGLGVLRRAQLHARDQAAQVLITRAAGD